MSQVLSWLFVQKLRQLIFYLISDLQPVQLDFLKSVSQFCFERNLGQASPEKANQHLLIPGSVEVQEQIILLQFSEVCS